LERFFQQHVNPIFEITLIIVAEIIALQLKQVAIANGKTGANVYRSTIGFAGAMILAGGLLLIVRSSTYVLVLANIVSVHRVQKYGYKSKDTGNVGCIGFWKRHENYGGNCICIKIRTP